MIKVIKANDHDSNIISRLIRESFKLQAELLGLKEEEYPNYAGFETPERTGGRIERGDTVLLALLEGIPAGTVSCGIKPGNPGRGFISRLCVLPLYRRNSFGKKLMSAAEEQLALLGASTSEISIAAQFTRLENYYQSLGYVLRDKKNVPSLPFPVLYMKKRL